MAVQKNDSYQNRDAFPNSETICSISSNQAVSVSSATLYNWRRLNQTAEGRLLTRANKTKSTKRILPIEYFSNQNNISFVQNILELVEEQDYSITSILFSLSINLLNRAGISAKDHVKRVLNEYTAWRLIPSLIEMVIPTDEFDLLGLIYQSYILEGKKAEIGSYYTPQLVAKRMTNSFDFSSNQMYFDPCCGSGAFLLAVDAVSPDQLYGIDCDEIAVFLAKINLLLKYRTLEFIPKIFCLDYIAGYSLLQNNSILTKEFDYIATNPPWGATNDYLDENDDDIGTFKESFSVFFIKAFRQLKQGGVIRFLFPESILNVKSHKNIRRFILEKTKLMHITSYGNSFSGVTTKFIDIACRKSEKGESFIFENGNESRLISIRNMVQTDNLVLSFMNDNEICIVNTVKEKGVYSLKSSVWALGIVTGNNKGKLLPSPSIGAEEVFTGKDIQPFVLKHAKNYIIYDRENFQQVAKDEIYRAKEKLVYKFISYKPVFAYDNQQRLFLNSANILIPNIPCMCIKTVLAFLNSSLFQFMYAKMFGEVKVLKGNLIELPFPKISKEEDSAFEGLVDRVLSGDKSAITEIDNSLFRFYHLSEEQIKCVRSSIKWKD